MSFWQISFEYAPAEDSTTYSWTPGRPEKNKRPVLLLYGKKDQLVPEKPTLQLWERLKKTDRDQFIEYDDGWHMLMRDLSGKQVMDDIIGWIGIGK